MAYTVDQLSTFFKNANAGTVPTAAQTLSLQALANQNAAGTLTNDQAMAATIDLASDQTTAVSVGTYQFFLGYAPSEAGLAALNGAYVGTGSQAAFNGENRFIAQSISLALDNPAAKTKFTNDYGSLSVSDTIKTAYDIIIGNAAAAAAGINVANSLAYLNGQVAYYTAFVKQVLPNASAADQALALKAAIVGEILFVATSYNNGAGIGSYATASTNLIKDLADDGHLVNNNNAGVDLFSYGPGGAGSTFKLTAGIDGIGSFTGTAANDTFVGNTDAGVLAYTSLDAIDGGAGTDTLSISVVGAVDTTAAVGASVKNIEKVVITSTGAVTTDTTSWTGVTSLTTSSIGNSTLTASTTTDVTATVAAPTGAGAAVINGGKAVTLAVSDTAAADVATGNTVSIGATTAATGAVVVTQSETFAASANTAASALGGGSITINGGTTVNVTNTATVGAGDNAGDVVTLGTVTVNGKGTATSVSVTQSASTATWATAGDKYKITAGVVAITDNNTATKSDTITSVTLTNYGASTFVGNALTTLNLTGGSSASSASSTLGISQSAGLTTAAPTALTINASGRLGGITDTNNQYTSLNIVSDKAATIADLDFTSVKTLAVSGAAVTTISALTDLSSATSITSTGAGLTITPTLATGVLFTGGAGVESITLGATTKAINMGAGNDVVTLTTTTLGAGGSVNGGDGTDVLVANTNGSSFSADPAFGGFETLRVAGGAATGSHNANGFTALELGATLGAVTFTNVAVNVGLTVLAAPTGTTTVTLANATGTADTFALTLSSSGVLAAGTINLAGVETVNIAANDTDTTAHVDTLTLQATSAKTIVVTGSAGLSLINTSNVNVTSFDASASTGAITYASANATVGEVVSIKGGAGADTLTGTATAIDTIIGGAGADTITHNGGADVFTGGAGADTFVSTALGTKTAYLTITDATSGDKLDVAGLTGTATAAVTVGAAGTLGAAATFDQYLDNAAAGSGAAAALITWFQFEGNTYVVVDNTAGATFAATDSVIKLTGLVNLEGSAIATDVITIA